MKIRLILKKLKFWDKKEEIQTEEVQTEGEQTEGEQTEEVQMEGIKGMKRINGKKLKKLKKLTIEERKELLKAGYTLSRKYDYHKLMKAADTKGAALIEGREVHGYMRRMFSNYEWLINNDVFDFAVDFAQEYYRPYIFNVVKDYDFDNALVNIAHLPKEINFDHYRNFKFNKIIILTQKEPFENAVHWIENYEWEDENGYNTTKTLAPCNFLSMGFTLWDLPVTVLKDAVGKDKLFFEARTTAEQIIGIKDQILKKHIYTKRQEEKTTDEKVLEMEIRHDQLEERHQYLIDDIRAGDSRNAEEKLRDFAKRYDKKTHQSPVNWKRLIYALIVISLIIFIIGMLFFLFVPRSSAPKEIPETASLLLSSIYSRGC